MFGQIELCFPERRRFVELRIEVDEIVGLYFLQRLVLYQFFKLETDFFRAIGNFFLLFLAEVEGIIVFEMWGFGVGVRFYLILAALKHKVEQFEIAVNNPFFLACFLLVHVEHVRLNHVELD